MKLWSGRFGKETDALVNDFNASIGFDARLYKEDIEGSLAHAKMLGDCGILATEDVIAITVGLQGILTDIEAGKVEFSADNEDIHMALGQEFLLASPVSAAARLFVLARTAAFWGTVGYSTLRILGGFLLACAGGVVCAALAVRFRRVRELIAPLVAAVKAIPVASFIIVMLIWVPPRDLSLLTAFLMVFPPVYLNLLEGMTQTDPKLLEMAQVFRVPLLRRIKGIYVPQTLPYFRSACSLALGLCWKAGVAAEVIGLPTGSLGERLYTAKIYLETPDLFAWTATIVAVSVLFEKGFLWLVTLAEQRSRG